MNAHVFVLVLLSAAFMAVWDGDQNHNNQVLISRARARAAVVAPVAENSQRTPRIRSADVSTQQQPQAASTLAAPSTVALPTDLPAGTWRVVSDRGDSMLITIERTSDSAASLNQESDLPTCVTTVSNDRRWCFFRQESVSNRQADRRGEDIDTSITK